jgi:hypothetical protein
VAVSAVACSGICAPTKHEPQPRSFWTRKLVFGDEGATIDIVVHSSDFALTSDPYALCAVTRLMLSAGCVPTWQPALVHVA